MSESENKHFESTDSRVYVSNGTCKNILIAARVHKV